MALFTDSDVVTLDDLLQFESSLVQITSTHGVDVLTKIKLATAEISDKLLLALLQAGASDPQWSTRNKIGLSTVVVSPAIYRWLCFDSLARIFAEAYNVQLNTRFQGKWTEYQQQSTRAANMVLASGVGIVSRPLSKPEPPTIEQSNGTISIPALFVQTTWSDSTGNESALSSITGAVLGGASSVEVAVTDSPNTVPKAAVGWNVYVSEVQQGLTRQNSTPIAIGMPWQMPGEGLIAGARHTSGQDPDVTVPFSRRWMRG